MLIQVARLTIALVLLAGCATLPPAGEVEPASLAMLRPEFRMRQRVRILEVDGRKLGMFRDRAALAPGRHEVVADTELIVGGRKAYVAHRLSFDAEPGRRYLVRADWYAYGPRIWIEESGSGDRVAVAETRPPPIGAR